MSLYDWLLFLHLLAAASLVAALVAYGVMVLGDPGGAARRALALPATALWTVGGLGVLVLGIALAIDVDAYSLGDGWIIAAIVLWLVASAAGGNLSRGMREEDAAGAHGPDPRVLFAVMAVATLLLLVDMIFKPGA
jgi:uncharacterized membrane protein